MYVLVKCRKNSHEINVIFYQRTSRISFWPEQKAVVVCSEPQTPLWMLFPGVTVVHLAWPPSPPTTSWWLSCHMLHWLKTFASESASVSWKLDFCTAKVPPHAHRCKEHNRKRQTVFSISIMRICACKCQLKIRWHKNVFSTTALTTAAQHPARVITASLTFLIPCFFPCPVWL